MDHRKEFCSIIGKLAWKYNRHEVFSDFCEIAALSLRQVFERKPENEEKYLTLINRYEPAEQSQFAELLAITVSALTDEPRDFLSECFHELELHNQYKGQFFTPFSVSRMMAKMSLTGVEDQIREHGFIELNEPTCGAGGMVIAAAEEIKQAGFNPVNVFFAVAQDIDRKCCNMAYIQLSLLAIPAAVIWGNTLLLECREEWLTAGYYLGAWPERFHWRRALNSVKTIIGEGQDGAQPAANTSIPVEDSAGQLLFNF